jgi:ribosomal protein S12 methylthiotransferase accessory factor
MDRGRPTWFDDLVSDRVGIVRSLSVINRGATEPSPPVFYQAVLAHFDFRNARIEERIGVGKGLTDAEAQAGAIGEALERYCASQPCWEAIRRFAWADRPGDAVGADACVLYSDRQYQRADFPYRRWRNDQVVPWSPAVNLEDGAPVWLPTSLVYLDYSGNDADTFFCPPTSNGLAAGETIEAAALSALYELVERDAFLATWMHRLPTSEVIAPADAAVEAEFLRHYARFGIEVRVFRLETDIPVHVMMAVLLDRSGRSPAALVGLGCYADPRLAFRKAIFEAAQTRPGYVQRFADRGSWENLRTYRDVRSLDDHSSFFASQERLPELAFLLDTRNLVGLADLPCSGAGDTKTELNRVVAALVEAGCQVICADITTSDLQCYPIRVVRAVATGLQPIHFGYGEERLGGTRLFELPMRLGRLANIADESSLNPCPHPLS